MGCPLFEDRLVKAIVNDARGRARGCNSAIASPKDREIRHQLRIEP